MPAAAHTEKAGSFTNTQRMLQWHHLAVEPPGDARSELWFTYHLGRRIRAKLAAIDRPRWTGPCLDLTWDYPTEGEVGEPDAEAVLAEINGCDADGKPLASYLQLTDDGSTTVRLLDLRRRLRRRGQPGGPAQARRPSRTGWPREWGWAWPANRRILYNRASADPDGNRGASARRWSGGTRARSLDRARHPRLRPGQAAGLPAAGRRHRAGRAVRHRSVHHAGRRQGVAVRPGRAGGRAAAGALRAAGIPVPQPALRPAAQPGAAGNRVPAPRTTGCSPAAGSPAPRCSPTWPPPTG